jgi:hypothetical protein
MTCSGLNDRTMFIITGAVRFESYCTHIQYTVPGISTSTSSTVVHNTCRGTVLETAVDIPAFAKRQISIQILNVRRGGDLKVPLTLTAFGARFSCLVEHLLHPRKSTVLRKTSADGTILDIHIAARRSRPHSVSYSRMEFALDNVTVSLSRDRRSQYKYRTTGGNSITRRCDCHIASEFLKGTCLSCMEPIFNTI